MTDINPTIVQDPVVQDEPKKVELQARELAQKNKALQAEIDAYQKEKADMEAKKLEEQGRYKELLEAEKLAKAKLEAEIASKEKQLEINKAMQKAGLNPEFQSIINPDMFLNSDNLDETFEKLKSTTPSLFSQPPATPAGVVGVQATTSQSSGGLSLQQVEDMLVRNNYDEISANQKAIQTALKST
jgi:hypothetical protein